MSDTICYVAGKSGGHIIPALTHAQNVLKQDKKSRILFFSTDSDLDKSIIKKAAYVNTHIPLKLANVPRKNIHAWPHFFVQLFRLFWVVLKTFRTCKPKKVVSMGGYISVPVCCVAWLLRIPVEVYELNVVPGAAVKLLSRFAEKTHLCFEQTRYDLPQRSFCSLGKYPLRYNTSHKLSKQEACRLLGIDSNKKVMCVLGGSQGSQFINTLMTNYVRNLAQNSCVVLHQTGARDVASVQQAYQKYGVDEQVFSFRDDIHLCYSAADTIVARAGAGTLFEILFFQKPAVIIPLEASTTGHQLDNAQAMAQSYPKIFRVFRQKTLEKRPETMVL